MRKLILSFVAGAAALAAGGVAHAQPAPQDGPRALTRTVVEQRAAKTFDRLDVNRDGKLDQADRQARQKARFDRLDTDRDGSLSYAEFGAVHAKRDGAREARNARRGEGARGHRQAVALRGFAGRGGMIRMADADKDGAITRAEFQAAALQRFDRLDADKDGTVSREEAKAARDAIRQQWQTRREARNS
jgi:Ca2+-binding EF-hand superfamily protein